MNDVKGSMDQTRIEETETPQSQADAAVGADVGAVSRWISEHPRKILWFIVLILIPYVMLCWGATFTVLGALMTGGGCG